MRISSSNVIVTLLVVFDICCIHVSAYLHKCVLLCEALIINTPGSSFSSCQKVYVYISVSMLTTDVSTNSSQT